MQQEGKEPLGLEELREKLVAPMDCSSLAEYLEKFELPLGCLHQFLDQGQAHRTVQMTVQLYFWHIVCNKSIHHRLFPLFCKL